ncbi:CoA-binding protein [Magnetospira sp. QH-2]|uniref:CoA-binding protein n=1 Tax=Magnetospira sp. (strain QH-2) TaxID=1288970 RepID=UPI0003E81371|nr:CoA-binding protein [Magnetospira sp. QH-2]CCQ73680.1 Conserved protein of unknown function [Magnetospira sp. QH-2]
MLDDNGIRDLLKEIKVIALVGASPKAERPSFQVMQFLQNKGYRVIPVNPGLAGQILNGETVVGSLAEVPAPCDMVDIFRAPEAAGMVSDEAVRLAAEKGFKAVWMQLNIRHDEAAARAEAAGLSVVMDRCPKIEYPRLVG